jgi:hypothetical protein
MKDNNVNYGLKIMNRTNKIVLQYNPETNELIKQWDSLSLASNELNLVPGTLAYYCRFEKIKDGFLYKYQN